MKNHFKGKGTAAIICFCLAAVAALGIFSYNKSAKELRSELSGVSSTSETAQTEAAQDANAAADNVPVEEAAAPQEDIILEHDAFGSDGRGNFDWKDAFRSTEHGSPPPSRTLSQAQWYVPQTVRYWKHSLTASW